VIRFGASGLHFFWRFCFHSLGFNPARSSDQVCLVIFVPGPDVFRNKCEGTFSTTINVCEVAPSELI
jgi:hypothetical protein